MNKNFGAFIDRIFRFASIFAPGLYRVSQKTKIIITLCAAGGIIAVIVILTGIFSSDGGPSGYPIKIEPLSGKDRQGNQWVIEVLEGQPRLFYSSNKLKTGAPLLVSTSVEFKESDALIGIDVKGQAGEKYSGGALKNGKQVEAPTFDILDEGGKTLASGQFKYG